MTKQEYFEFAENFFGECIEISRKKNADYTGDVSNPFANFEAVEMLHIGTAQGFLTRMQDKMMRIASFAKNGELQVKDESVQDTLRDLANYSCLFSGWIEAKKREEEDKGPKTTCSGPLSLIQKISMEYHEEAQGGFNFPLAFLDEIKYSIGLPRANHVQINYMLVNLLEK